MTLTIFPKISSETIKPLRKFLSVKNQSQLSTRIAVLICMLQFERYGKAIGRCLFHKLTKKMGIYSDRSNKLTSHHFYLIEGSILQFYQYLFDFFEAIFIFQTQQLFSNRMKSYKREQKQIQIIEKSSDDGDCSCQLLDTSLSNVGDSDCSCSECLQANLQAFNELKQEEEEREKESQTFIHRGGSTRAVSNKQTRGVSRNTVNQNKSTAKINGFKSIDKMRETRPKTSIQRKEQSYSSDVHQNGQNIPPKFSRECINDYIRITQHRARSYMQQRNGLKKTQEEKRRQLKQLIKENLQALKFTAKNLISDKQKQENSKNQIGLHNYQWNHTPYHCKSRVQCRHIKKYEPDLENKKEQIQKIQERIKKYKEQNKQKPYQCPDKCPKHHMRTSKKTLIEIDKFIQKKARDYKEAQKKAKAQMEQKQKIKQAKLRAIDLKCKEKVAKSKKYDPTQERTSFHNSIDHFSTFSQLRIHNKQRLEEKEQRRKIKAALKDGKQLQQAIYEDLEGELIGDHPPIHSKINVESRYVQGMPQQEEWCQKIVKDARIKPPKDFKKDDKQIKKVKEKKKIEQKQQQKTKKTKPNLSTRDLKKEQQRRKEIQAQIDRKKQQILTHYQKRNTNINKYDPKNKQLRQQYEQQLKQQSRQKNKQSPKQKSNDSYDPYRQVYKHQPTKDAKQMKIVGDPLMDEYNYERSSRRAQQLQVQPANKQIFTSSGKQLMQKKILKV